MNNNKKKNIHKDMRRRIRLTESDLHRIVKESVVRILSEDVEEGTIGNFFNRFRRSQDVINAAPQGQAHRYRYNPQTGTYWYKDDNGGRHDTKVGYESGRVGKNWNFFGNTNSDTQVSSGDLATAKGQLRTWHRRNAGAINQGNAQAAQQQELQRRRERERYQSERPHRVGAFGTDQAGHSRAYFDDQAADDAMLR